MRKYGLAALFVVAFAFPASAATKYFVVVDTLKNCSVIEGNPSAGLTPIGNKDGYDSKDAAKEALKACATTRRNVQAWSNNWRSPGLASAGPTFIRRDYASASRHQNTGSANRRMPLACF